MLLSNNKEIEDNEIPDKEREESNDRRGGNDEVAEDFDRWSNQRYMEEFEKVFSGGDAGNGEGLVDTVKESVSKDGDSEQSEYEGYEEW